MEELCQNILDEVEDQSLNPIQMIFLEEIALQISVFGVLAREIRGADHEINKQLINLGFHFYKILKEKEKTMPQKERRLQECDKTYTNIILAVNSIMGNDAKLIQKWVRNPSEALRNFLP